MGTETIRLRELMAYGTALSALGAAHVAEGAVVALTPNPGTVPFVVGSAGSNVSFGVPGLTVFQFNDTIGKTLGTATSTGGTIVGIRGTTAGNTITTGLAFTNGLGYGTSASGTRTFGFLTAANQVGWFQIDFGGVGNPTSFLAAAYETTPGGTIVAGGAVPEPASGALFALGTLALGAVSVRKRRNARAAARSAPPHGTAV